MFTQYPLINEEVVNTLIEMARDDSLVKELFSSYLNDLDELIEKSNSAHKSLNIDSLKVDIHTLKGVSGTIGCERMFECCKAINNDLKSGVESNLDGQMIAFNQISKDLVIQIQEKYV